MTIFLILIFTYLSAISFWLFLRKYKLSPLWLMLSVWFVAIGISQLHLSSLEWAWPIRYWILLGISLVSFVLGSWMTKRFVILRPQDEESQMRSFAPFRMTTLRWIIYILFVIGAFGLYLFYKKAGNFPLFASDPDEFRFVADSYVPGLINYLSQLARIFIPLSFFVMFFERFSFKKHWDLVILAVVGIISLLMFASRTQIFFIDLWVMALYLLMRKPSWKQALKFYPTFLLISVLVLAAVPIYRQYKSYGAGYLAGITGIDTSGYSVAQKAFMPIYVGISFNQQALLHAEQYYQTHDRQHGKVSLDPFTNIFGKIIKPLNKLKSSYDLGAIFYPWWNTGTYLFPFVQDFGTAAFYFVPFIFGVLLTLLWRYWQINPNFLSINLYAYGIFFIVMGVYVSFTVRAEMYLDLMLLFVVYFAITKKIHQK